MFPKKLHTDIDILQSLNFWNTFSLYSKKKSINSVSLSFFNSFMKVNYSSSQICKNFLQLGPPAISIVSLKRDIICGVGWDEADPPTSQMGRFFLVALALSVTIFNQKYHQTKAVERLKLQTCL